MTNKQIMSLIPKSKRAAIRDAYEDQDGIWICLNEGWNADNMDSVCRTIHCGGEDEPISETIQDIKYQVDGIRRVRV